MTLDQRASPALMAALAPRMTTGSCNTEPGTSGCLSRRCCSCGLAGYNTGKLAIRKSVGGLPGNRRHESPGRTGDPCKISDEAVSTRM